MTRVYQNFQAIRGGGGPLVNFLGVSLRVPDSTSTALADFNATRQREKHELEQLNDKLAQYVEKVKFLEIQNKKLQMELDILRSRAGQDSSCIKEMYDIEKNEASKLIDSTKYDNASAANVRAQQTEKEVEQLRVQYNEVSK
ncbi:unnamed protein product [Rotaria sordida]|uniref:IF rod domain-containing protein n=2 Tax=Rotaria sordida TaxID=392033 RepID=A0A819C9G2_9BILA|nr:unnamed protein product [Rotaria sordida]